MAEIREIALTAFLIALSTLVVAVIRYASAWLGAKAQAIRNEELRKRAEHTRRLIEQELIGAVKETTQVYVSERKSAAADGKLTDEEKKKAREMALNVLAERLKAAGINTAHEVIPALAEWAVHEIESTLFDTKLLEQVASTASPKSP